MVVLHGVVKSSEHLCTSTFSKKTSKGPESAVFVPESAVFPTYDLEVSKFFRNFAMHLRSIDNDVFASKIDRSGCRIRPRRAPNCAS